MVRRWFAASACVLFVSAGMSNQSLAGSPQRDQALVAVARVIHPIETTEPSESVDDLAFLSEYIGDATVVGLGEATHGTREFFQLKHRIFQYLVEHEGFTTFGIEAKFEPSLAIDRYIKTGEGDVEKLVNGLGFWTWDTEEVIELVEWMRDYNARGDDQLNFYGFDVQGGRSAIPLALDYAARHAEVETAETRERFDLLMDFSTLEGAELEAAKAALNRPETITGLHRAAIDLSIFLERNAHVLIESSGESEFQVARGAAQVAVWWLAMALRADEREYIRSTSETDVRDRGMANLVHWMRDIEGDDERIALWAHNAHVGMIKDMNDTRVMGMLLEQELGSDYYSVGFSFEQGSFQAFLPATDSQPAKFMEHTVPAASEDSVEGFFADIGSDVFFVDMAAAANNSAAKSWLEVPRRMRWTGARYSDELEAKHPPIPVLEMFDGLVFVRHSSRARPSAAVRERYGITATGDDSR